jgi:acylphosphatase
LLSLETLEGRALPSATTGAPAEPDGDDVVAEVAEANPDHASPPGQETPPEQPGRSCTKPQQEALLSEGAQPEPKPPCGPLPPPPAKLLHFLKKLYLDLLRRDADPDGLEGWRKRLEDGMSREDVATHIANSEECQKVKVRDLYRKHLGREADEGGLKGFADALTKGASLEEVQTTILGSDEYFRKHGGNNNGLVKALYQDLLGREVDPAGAAAWAEKLAQGEGKEHVAKKILGSHECHKRRVDELFRQHLNRPADEHGLNGFVHALQNGAGHQHVQTHVVGSEEYFDRE